MENFLMEGAIESEVRGVPVEEPSAFSFSIAEPKPSTSPAVLGMDLKIDDPGLPHNEESEPTEGATARTQDTSGSADERSSVQCRCGSLVRHRGLVNKLNRIMKALDVRAAKRSYEIHGLEKEDLPTEADEHPSLNLLKVLLKRVIKKCKTVAEIDRKSVLTNQQAINKLKHSGFQDEYRVFQSLHDAKVSGQSDACSRELTKMLEKCRL